MSEKMNVDSKFYKLLTLSILFLFVFIPYREILSYTISSKLKLITDILIFVLLIIDVLVYKGLRKFNIVDLAFGLFLAAALVSTLSGYNIKAYILEVRSITLYYFIYFIIRDKVFHKDFILKLKKVLTFNTIILMAFAIIEMVTNKGVLFPSAWAESLIGTSNYSRIYGMFNNPNTFGAYLLFCFLVFIVIDYKTRENSRWMYSVFFLGLLMTMSRSSILALALALLIIFMFIRDWKFIKSVILWILIGTVIYGGLTAISGPISSMISKSNFGTNNSVLKRFGELGTKKIITQSNADGRIFSIKTGLKVFKDHKLIGSGFGTYGDAASLMMESPIYSKYGVKNPNFYADNEYIKVLVETGIVGSAMYILFILAILYKTIREKSFFNLSFMAVLLFMGLFYNVFEVQIVSMFFWFLLGWTELDRNRI